MAFSWIESTLHPGTLLVWFVSGDKPQDLDAWVDKLSASGMPIFSETVRAVSGVVSRRETSAHDLAGAIGRDAALAARLLKVANSPLFNLQHRDIDTISSAVVLLGFDAVRDLAISLSLIEQVLKGRSHERVTRSLARSFHAAAQARSFSAALHDDCPEGVFVAALLRNIGEMAFWANAREEAAAIDRLIRAGTPSTDAERQVLGFELQALSRRLVEDWQLGGLLEASLSGSADDGRTVSVQLGHRVAEVVDQHGWDSREVRAVLCEVEDHLNINAARTLELVRENVEEAAKIANRYGVAKVEKTLLEDISGAAAAMADSASEDQATKPKAGNPAVQLSALQRISAELESGVDLDRLLDLVLSGIADGVGFDRAYFAELTADRHSVRMRRATGFRQMGLLNVVPPEPNLFQVIIQSGKSLMVTPESRKSLAALIDAQMSRWLGEAGFVASPISVGGQVVGILYADNDDSGADISDEAFAGLRHFGQQIALGLNASAA